MVSDGATDMVATASARRVNFNAKINDIGSLRTCLLWFLWNPILFMVFEGCFKTCNTYPEKFKKKCTKIR